MQFPNDIQAALLFDTRIGDLEAVVRTFLRVEEARTGARFNIVERCFVSGVIEGFVTPSGLPTEARVAIGILAELAFLTSVFVLGRQAARRGVTGDVDSRYLEDRVATQE